MAKLHLCFITVLSLTLLCGCGVRSPERALNKGLAEFQAKEYSKAISTLSKATNKLTDSEELFYTLGLCHLQLGDMDKALKAFNRTMDLNPAHYEALTCRGQIAYYKNDLDSARKYYLLALKLAKLPRNRAVLFTSMALTESGLKNDGLARLYLLRAINCDKNYAPAYYNLATLYRDKFGFKEEALKYFEKFSEVAEKDESHFDKADKNIKRLQDNIKRTADANRVKRDPESASRYLNQGVEYQSEKKYREAIESYDKALSADPRAFSAAYGRAMAWQQLNNSRNALNGFKAALEINPDHRDSYSRAVGIAIELKRFSEGTALLDKAIARNPDYASWYDLMTRLLFEQAKYVEARKYGEHYITMLKPGDNDRKAYEKWVHGMPEG